MSDTFIPAGLTWQEAEAMMHNAGERQNQENSMTSLSPFVVKEQVDGIKQSVTGTNLDGITARLSHLIAEAERNDCPAPQWKHRPGTQHVNVFVNNRTVTINGPEVSRVVDWLSQMYAADQQPAAPQVRRLSLDTLIQRDTRFGMNARYVTEAVAVSIIGPYAWPGGYAVSYITEDGARLCPTCARDELVNGWIKRAYVETSADNDDAYNGNGIMCDGCNAWIVSPKDAS